MQVSKHEAAWQMKPHLNDFVGESDLFGDFRFARNAFVDQITFAFLGCFLPGVNADGLDAIQVVEDFIAAQAVQSGNVVRKPLSLSRFVIKILVHGLLSENRCHSK